MNLVRDLRPWMVVSALATASASMGQQAVEWKVSEGGNGHWYQRISEPGDWYKYRNRCAAKGGHLVTISNLAENTMVRSLGDPSRFYMGGYQPNPTQATEPAGGWEWVTGEPWVFQRWSSSEPNNLGQQDWLVMYEDGTWDDGTVDGSNVQSFVCEWDADCNSDGIVDYGQILAGELADSNGNGVPDCCETGEPCNAANLVLNGTFEAGTPLAACASESAASPNTLAPGWQVSVGRVDRVRAGSACASSTQPKFGDYCVDLCGTPASSGAIRQVTATIPGHRYRCTFWLSGDASAGPAAKKMHAKVGTYVDLSYTFTCSGTGAQAWVSNQFEFTARGANETLEFAADNGVTTGGPMLDAVSLVDITSQCVGDLDGSGNVDGADIALLLLNFGDCTP